MSFLRHRLLANIPKDPKKMSSAERVKEAEKNGKKVNAINDTLLNLPEKLAAMTKARDQEWEYINSDANHSVSAASGGQVVAVPSSYPLLEDVEKAGGIAKYIKAQNAEIKRLEARNLELSIAGYPAPEYDGAISPKSR